MCSLAPANQREPLIGAQERLQVLGIVEIQRRLMRKLTEEQVQDVRYIGAGSITEAARKYGITKSEAAAIVQGRSYRDVPLSDREIAQRIFLCRLAAEQAAIPTLAWTLTASRLDGSRAPATYRDRIGRQKRK